DGSASIGLIVHETGHQYVMGQLANNEWREGWLDEGFSDFQEGWFFEAHGGPPAYDGLEPGVLWLDLERWSEPISTVSEQFRDFLIYQEMIYSKAQLFYEQLRYVVGDETMRRILREYFARWKLKHVDEDAFRRVAEEVSRVDLKWLFGEWLHATPLIDYRLRRVERHRLAGGRWRTVVTVQRRGDGRMPVEIGDRDTIYARATGEPVTERVEFTSARKPGRLMLDPRGRTHDYDMLNNRERRAFVGRGAVDLRLDDPTRERARRDKLVSAWLPVAWSSDFGGVTLAVRNRTNYLDRYNRGLSIASVATGNGASQRFGFYGRWSNPIRHLMPRTETGVAAWAVEGRARVFDPLRRRGVRPLHGRGERAGAVPPRHDLRRATVRRRVRRPLGSRAAAPHSHRRRRPLRDVHESPVAQCGRAVRAPGLLLSRARQRQPARLPERPGRPLGGHREPGAGPLGLAARSGYLAGCLTHRLRRRRARGYAGGLPA